MVRIFDGMGVRTDFTFSTTAEACAWVESNPPELRKRDAVIVLAEGSVEYWRLLKERSGRRGTRAFMKLCESGDDLRRYPFEAEAVHMKARG